MNTESLNERHTAVYQKQDNECKVQSSKDKNNNFVISMKPYVVMITVMWSLLML